MSFLWTATSRAARPIHFDLVTEDEKIVDAIPSISYVHRGLERLVEKRDFVDMVHVADRICGLCSFMHALGYCQAVEEIMKIEVPERALYLRVIWAELSRVHSHIFWFRAADASVLRVSSCRPCASGSDPRHI
jgi:ech hydrogenase subunit E